MSDAADSRADLVQVPAGTPPGFPLAKVLGEERPEFDAPFPESFVTDLNAALVKQFLNISVAAKRPHGRCSGQEAEREAVVQPNNVLDDGHWKTVAVGLEVGHGGSG